MQDNQEISEMMNRALERWFGPCSANLARKWHGGHVVLQPEDPALQPKQFAMATLAHKVVMVREALRVLEQRINNHPKLDDADRIQLQQYITRVHGSLTTFNVIFADEEDKFSGQRT